MKSDIEFLDYVRRKKGTLMSRGALDRLLVLAGRHPLRFYQGPYIQVGRQRFNELRETADRRMIKKITETLLK